MNKFYTPDTFDPDKYKRSGWTVSLIKLMDGSTKLIVRVSTGRRTWPLFSLEPNFELGLNDPTLRDIKFSLNYYTFPMVNRFVDELNIMLSDLYKVDIEIRQIESISKPGFSSSNNF